MIKFEISIIKDNKYKYVIYESNNLNDVLIYYYQLKQIGYKPILYKTSGKRSEVIKEN